MPQRRRARVGPYVDGSPPSRGRLGDARPAEAERARLARARRRQPAPRRMIPTGMREELVAVRGGVDDRRDPAARSQGPADPASARAGRGSRSARPGRSRRRSVPAATAVESSPSASSVVDVGEPGLGGRLGGVGRGSPARCRWPERDRSGRPGARRPGSGRRRRRRRRARGRPAPTPAASSICSVAAPSQFSSVGPQRCHASAASSHWARVVVLKATGSKVAVMLLLDDVLLESGEPPPCGSASRTTRAETGPRRDYFWTFAHAGPTLEG